MPARIITVASLFTSCLITAAMGTGCSGRSPSSAEAEKRSAAPALSKEQAQQVLDSYAAGANRLRLKVDRRALAAIEAEPQLSMDEASLKLRRVIKRPPPEVKFMNTSFYIPRVSGYPRWFAAATVTGQGKRSVRHALLFTQDKAGTPWLLTANPYPTSDALGNVALDSEGYATPVDADEREGLATAPGTLPEAHAALLTDGPGAPKASLLADGAQTSETYKALKQGEKSLAGRGVTLSSRFSPTQYRVFALRTKDRGALVWYVIKQNEAYSSAKRGRLAVGGDLLGLAPVKAARTRMDTTVLVQYLAAVPPKGRATVTGMYRKAVTAHGT
ncbi:hypothetical protein E1264_22505 [Actinomadura sp. KC216]|uniref:hypothetical protein n=1 Tax=Actinomadura sp. KC216 TaxID=2530370 RepID=UPI001047E995|nr:hypothetical protein [Actinomadura sp. KC216]TDB85066.1 hypothetical protein E1264_22505 [Actinomadura sp. KC216]